MLGDSLRALLDEPRPPHPPARVWRDWVLLGVAVAASLIEAGLALLGVAVTASLIGVGVRPDGAWLLAALVVSIVVALSLLWRRTHPLAAVAVAFGTMIVFDVARIMASDATGLSSIAVALVLPYALFRWGSGREAAVGLGIILVWLGVTHVADPTTVGDVVAAYGFFLFSAAWGASIRFHTNSRLRAIEQAKLRQRNELARELHDTVGHHVSAIAIQAQAGQAVAASDPARVLAVLETIEKTATRTLEEMRAMVGILRDGTEPDLVPQPRIGDLERLASNGDGGPRIDVHLPGTLDDLPPSVGAALYRIGQEAVTNAQRHARNATRVTVEVEDDAELVTLTVRDDGTPRATADPTAGYGLLGMTERASLLGGTLRAGPAPQRGWTVQAMLPKSGHDPSRPRATSGPSQT